MNIPKMDWEQVMQNGGPPCFRVESGKFCGRAQSWPYHRDECVEFTDHKFISFEEYLSDLTGECQRLREALRGLDTLMDFSDEIVTDDGPVVFEYQDATAIAQAFKKAKTALDGPQFIGMGEE